MTEPRYKIMPTHADSNMINSAFMLLESMKGGTEQRNKKIVAAIWETMAAVSPPPRQSGLTRVQQRAHETIADYIAEHGQSPTYEEIGQQMGKNKSDIHRIVHFLKNRGVISVKGQAKRSIVMLVQPGEPIPGKRAPGA